MFRLLLLFQFLLLAPLQLGSVHGHLQGLGFGHGGFVHELVHFGFPGLGRHAAEYGEEVGPRDLDHGGKGDGCETRSDRELKWRRKGQGWLEACSRDTTENASERKRQELEIQAGCNVRGTWRETRFQKEWSEEKGTARWRSKPTKLSVSLENEPAGESETPRNQTFENKKNVVQEQIVGSPVCGERTHHEDSQGQQENAVGHDEGQGQDIGEGDPLRGGVR